MIFKLINFAKAAYGLLDYKKSLAYSGKSNGDKRREQQFS